MAIILISNNGDVSTNRIVEWLQYFRKDYVRTSFDGFVFGRDFNLSLSKEEDDLSFVNNGKEVFVEAVWYRLDVSQINVCGIVNSRFYNVLNQSLVQEIRSLKRALYVQNGSCRWLSNYESTMLNKITVLREAKSVGLVLPDTLITSSRSILERFVNKHTVIITKAVNENLSYTHILEDTLRQYVEELDCAKVASLKEAFFPSFFQKAIPKAYDVRVFYLDGKCYSMAIFSQCIDFRSDYENHFRTPLKLPKDLEQKIDVLMHKLGLNTGSLDFVKSSEDGLFYFLEVNPNGQFEMVSAPCNYYLEREIANYLCYEN